MKWLRIRLRTYLVLLAILTVLFSLLAAFVNRQLKQHNAWSVLKAHDIEIYESEELLRIQMFSFGSVDIQQPEFAAKDHNLKWSWGSLEKLMGERFEICLINSPLTMDEDELLLQLDRLPNLRKIWASKAYVDQEFAGKLKRRFPEVEIELQ